MSFYITIKSCTPMLSNLKARNLFCSVKIGDQTFKTAPFKGKDRSATWDQSFAINVKESFLKIEVWEDGFFGDTLHGDCIINLSKFYSTPGLSHTENVSITKDFKPVAQVLISVQYMRDAQTSQPVPVQPIKAPQMAPMQPAQQQTPQVQARSLTPAKPYMNQDTKIKSIQPKAPQQVYDVPVPFNDTRNTRLVSRQSMPQFERQYPQPVKGSFLNKDVQMQSQQANFNAYGRANTINDRYYQQPPIRGYGYSQTNLLGVGGQHADFNGPVDPSVLIRLLAGEGPNIPQVSEVPVYQPNYGHHNQYQEYNPMAWN